MATHRNLDERLIREAKQLGGHKTKRATVTAALEEYVRRRKKQQVEILSLIAAVECFDDYDHKPLRHRKGTA